ncbi:tetra-peptide repeat homeobox-like protein isoform X3 [Macaca fascicularis]|uniref:tetra-peptide repeat homeobox-like protein isoform X3 n=1 Tax=Macaca fascicularis TaxID=9541 RepID=UPI003D15B626
MDGVRNRAGPRMQDPRHPRGLPPSPGLPKRQRQDRTVYNWKQQEVLENHFKKEPYPGYDTRQKLAEMLNLGEYQVQTQSFPDFAELLSPLDQFEGSLVSTTTSQYQDGNGSTDKKTRAPGD